MSTPVSIEQGWEELGFEVTQEIPRRRKKSAGKPRKMELFGILRNIRNSPSLVFFGISEAIVKTSEELRNSLGVPKIEEELP